MDRKAALGIEPGKRNVCGCGFTKHFEIVPVLVEGNGEVEEIHLSHTDL
jgi:hypothetical protein